MDLNLRSELEEILVSWENSDPLSETQELITELRDFLVRLDATSREPIYLFHIYSHGRWAGDVQGRQMAHDPDQAMELWLDRSGLRVNPEPFNYYAYSEDYDTSITFD